MLTPEMSVVARDDPEPGDRSFFQVSHVRVGAQGLELPSQTLSRELDKKQSGLDSNQQPHEMLGRGLVLYHHRKP